jgi:hypothetical protein
MHILHAYDIVGLMDSWPITTYALTYMLGKLPTNYAVQRR